MIVTMHAVSSPDRQRSGSRKAEVLKEFVEILNNGDKVRLRSVSRRRLDCLSMKTTTNSTRSTNKLGCRPSRPILKSPRMNETQSVVDIKSHETTVKRGFCRKTKQIAPARLNPSRIKPSIRALKNDHLLAKVDDSKSNETNLVTSNVPPVVEGGLRQKPSIISNVSRNIQSKSIASKEKVTVPISKLSVESDLKSKSGCRSDKESILSEKINESYVNNSQNKIAPNESESKIFRNENSKISLVYTGEESVPLSIDSPTIKCISTDAICQQIPEIPKRNKNKIQLKAVPVFTLDEICKHLIKNSQLINLKDDSAIDELKSNRTSRPSSCHSEKVTAVIEHLSKKYHSKSPAYISKPKYAIAKAPSKYLKSGDKQYNLLKFKNKYALEPRQKAYIINRNRSLDKRGSITYGGESRSRDYSIIKKTDNPEATNYENPPNSPAFHLPKSVESLTSPHESISIESLKVNLKIYNIKPEEEISYLKNKTEDIMPILIKRAMCREETPLQSATTANLTPYKVNYELSKESKNINTFKENVSKSDSIEKKTFICDNSKSSVNKITNSSSLVEKSKIDVSTNIEDLISIESSKTSNTAKGVRRNRYSRQKRITIDLSDKFMTYDQLNLVAAKAAAIQSLGSFRNIDARLDTNNNSQDDTTINSTDIPVVTPRKSRLFNKKAYDHIVTNNEILYGQNKSKKFSVTKLLSLFPNAFIGLGVNNKSTSQTSLTALITDGTTDRSFTERNSEIDLVTADIINNTQYIKDDFSIGAQGDVDKPLDNLNMIENVNKNAVEKVDSYAQTVKRKRKKRVEKIPEPFKNEKVTNEFNKLVEIKMLPKTIRTAPVQFNSVIKPQNDEKKINIGRFTTINKNSPVPAFNLNHQGTDRPGSFLDWMNQNKFSVQDEGKPTITTRYNPTVVTDPGEQLNSFEYNRAQEASQKNFAISTIKNLKLGPSANAIWSNKFSTSRNGPSMESTGLMLSSLENKRRLTSQAPSFNSISCDKDYRKMYDAKKEPQTSEYYNKFHYSQAHGGNTTERGFNSKDWCSRMESIIDSENFNTAVERPYEKDSVFNIKKNMFYFDNPSLASVNMIHRSPSGPINSSSMPFATRHRDSILKR